MILMQKLGSKLPAPLDKERRARFLQGLIPHSVSSLAKAPLQVNAAGCDPIGAYHLFVAITGVLGVQIDKAAKLLDEEVRKGN